MTIERQAALDALKSIVGDNHALTDPELLAGALIEPRGLYHGKALALVRPGSTAEVARVLAFCNEARIGVTPQGGNTGLVGGQTPDESGDEIILSTQRLKRIREIDPHADVMICEAGVTLAEAQAAALEADRLFPLSLAAEGTCTIGGNRRDQRRRRAAIAYGNARDLVTGVEAVLADGRIVNALSKLRKDNTGYDVKSLFVGAEGTLGIITAASLRLFPDPRARATAFVGLASPEDALEPARRWCASDPARCHQFRADRPLRARNHGQPRPGARDRSPSAAPLVRADRSVVAERGGIRRRRWSGARSGVRGRRHRRRGDRRFARAAPRVLASARIDLPEAQKAKAARSSTTSRSRSATCRPLSREATRAVEAFEPGARVGRLRPSRRRQHPFQRAQPLGADTAAFLERWDAMNEVVHGIVARMGGSYLGRARRRAAEARSARRDEGSGRARGHARGSSGARSERE